MMMKPWKDEFSSENSTPTSKDRTKFSLTKKKTFLAALFGVSTLLSGIDCKEITRTFVNLSSGGGRYRCGSGSAVGDIDGLIRDNKNMVFSHVDHEARNQRMDEHMQELAKDYSEYYLTHKDMHEQQREELDRREQDKRYPKLYINGAYMGSIEDVQKMRDEGKIAPDTMTCKYKRGANVSGHKNLFE